MNYRKIYDDLITNASQRVISGYVERHHIIPRCMGGSDSAQNLVNLTAREHFVAHQLLIKIYPSNKSLICAATLMCVGHSQRMTNRLYSWLREKFSEFMKERQAGINNSQFNTMWISNIVDQISVKVPFDHDVVYPWVIGRNIWNKEQRIKDHARKIVDAKHDRSVKRISVVKETVAVYAEIKSLRLTALQLNVSHIEVRNRIKKYELMFDVNILNKHGKRL